MKKEKCLDALKKVIDAINENSWQVDGYLIYIRESNGIRIEGNYSKIDILLLKDELEGRLRR